MRRVFRQHLHQAKKHSRIPGFAIREIWWSKTPSPCLMPGQQRRSVSVHKQGKGAVFICAKHNGGCTYSEMRISLMQPPGEMGGSVSPVCWWMSWHGNWYHTPHLDFGLHQDRGDPGLQIYMASDPVEQKWFIYRKVCSIFCVRTSCLLYDIYCLLWKCPIAFMKAQLASSHWSSQKSLFLVYWSCYM